MIEVARVGGFRCHAGKDGDCNWGRCPQNRDGEPTKSGRHCPLDIACGDPCCDAPERIARLDRRAAPQPLSLMSEAEHQAGLKRAEALMGAVDQAELVELDALVNRLCAYEALDDAATAIITEMHAHSDVRRNPRLRPIYSKRAEVAVRAWLKALNDQGVIVVLLPTPGGP